MGNKIFVSYKYGDTDVPDIPGVYGTSVRHYVDALQAKLAADDHINKGEKDDESLAGFKDDTVASKLREKIYDSSVTVLLLSKNMKNLLENEEEQWIPWEVSYSLREKTRNGKTSSPNALLAVVIPDKNGSYDHFLQENICINGCRTWLKDSKFAIIGKNMFNRKVPKTFLCSTHSAGAGEQTHTGDDHSYIHPVKWDNFISNINGYLDIAIRMQSTIADFEVVKEL